MRRVGPIILGLVAAALVTACGLTVVGTGPADDALADASVDGSSGSRGDGGGSVEDASVTLLDGAAERPDAGVTFVPSHVDPTSYRLDAPDLVILAGGTVDLDTSALTIRTNGGAPQASPALVVSGSVAVLSVGTLGVSGTLRVRGARALVIVAAREVTIDGLVSARADGALPGPGGARPGAGIDGAASAGKNGVEVSGELGGGGGGGNGQAGGTGGGFGNDRGAAGMASNASGALLVGGAGGGRGARSIAGACGGAGNGGAGGGAIQISTLRSITVLPSGTFAVGGGGGRGGCRSNQSQTRTGGAGGGAGGTVVLEAVTGLSVAGAIDARGGGGGEGGGVVDDGADGDTAVPPPLGAALGGAGRTIGGSGGNGATRSFAAQPGSADTDSSGGGGGGLGRLFLRLRPPGTLAVTSTNVAAVRTDEAF